MPHGQSCINIQDSTTKKQTNKQPSNNISKKKYIKVKCGLSLEYKVNLTLEIMLIQHTHSLDCHSLLQGSSQPRD